LFAAPPNGDYDYVHDIFAVNFSNGVKVRRATKQEWESGLRIRTKPRLAFAKGKDDSSGEIEYKQKQKHYAKVGKYWGRDLISPGGRWLAVFSYTGVKPPPDLLFGVTRALAISSGRFMTL
jgi:hypothetical protein